MLFSNPHRRKRALRSQSIIDDISAISLSINGDTVVGSHIDFANISTTENVRLARDAMMDIIFGNDPSAVSFITTKENIGITIDHTGFSNTINAKNFNLSTIKVYSPGQTVDINNLISDDVGAYGALTQTSHEIKFKKYGKELHFVREFAGDFIMSDQNNKEIRT